MLLDAETIFDRNLTAFSTAAGTPDSSKNFRREYIAPALESCYRDGAALEAAYGAVISDYQRNGFIIGFKAAVQLLMSC